MKIKIRLLLTFSLLYSSLMLLAHAQGTAFTYQGRLNSGTNAAQGSYDLTFTLFNTNLTGTAIAGPVTNSAVSVTNGLFTTLVDLGNAFTGTSNWLELAVSTNGANSFTTLSPRQQLTPVPYAIIAGSVSGTISSSQLPTSVITNGASGVNITGTFAGDGSSLTNLNSTNLTGIIADNLLSTNIAHLLTPYQAMGTVSVGGIINGSINPITSVTLVNGGWGYTNAPAVTISANATGPFSGIGATATATVSNGVVTALTLVSGGSFYSSFATLSIAPPPPGYSNNIFVGPNYFAGQLVATNPANVFVGSSVGIGTTSPDRPLTIQGTGGGGEWISLKNTNGVTKWHLNNENGGLDFVQSGVADYRLFIGTNGYVGIGVNSPQSPLHVIGNNSQLRLQDSGYNNYWDIYTEYLAGNASGSGNLIFRPNNTTPYAYISRTTGSYNSSSDARLKKDIMPLNSVLAGVMQLEPVTYRFKSAGELEPSTYGLLAQQVEPLFPAVVSEADGYKGIAYSELVPVTIKAIQELDAKVEAENAQIQKKDMEIQILKQQNDSLAERLNELERVVTSITEKK